ncbi:helix-turn-helix domain-containing protein [Nocardia sp. NPDC051463]|uniref:helix-turn-helix domain-containing protein n=1 Tax=Nocardia sp. NPDC051463 TaxID=3154845 RepID=UPI00344D2189
MPRPRTHDPDLVLDAAQSLAVQSGPAAVTIRAVAAATGVSNGAIYHTFGSRVDLLGRSWLRAAHRFLAMQTELVDTHLAATQSAAIEAVLAAAETPVLFAEHFPESARLLHLVSRDELLGEQIPEALAAELAGTDRTLVELMIRLARALWDRGDARAVEVITTCLVDLPTAILLRRDQLTDPRARRQLRAAVRAVVDVGPH